ncbi:MAG TPA: hypothetical protein VHO29_00185 [Marmoricola sp.]|nr:hypothetical protein [Marmoricola sp.]
MNDLSQRLAHEADQFTRRGGTELELGQVLERAGEIRRGRRMRATLLMAACVLAIAVPTVLVATQRDTTHEPSPAPAPKIDHTAITLDHLKTGAKPKTGWVQGTVWHGPDGQEFTWTNGRASAVATVGTSTLLALDEGNGGMRATLTPPASGAAQSVTSWPMEGGFAVSPHDDVAAFVKPDGTPVLVAEGDTRELGRVPTGAGFTVAAITGTDCTRSNLSGCTVWVNSQGSRPAVWVANADGPTRKVDTGQRQVADVDAHQRTLGIVSVSDTGSCSTAEVIGGGPPLWKTCDHAPLSFSPDAQHVVATAAYRDGAGDSELAVLDSSTGKVRLDLTTAKGAFITQIMWEDDEHLLVAVGERQRNAVLRIGLDGRREYAVAPVTGDPYESPFVLPSH